jgi:Flp pilus assembly pilin Flp
MWELGVRYMNSLYDMRRGLCAGQLGAAVVEYTLMVGIIATVGICAIRTIGNSIAGSADPCKPGTIVRAAQILGGQAARELKCDALPTP